MQLFRLEMGEGHVRDVTFTPKSGPFGSVNVEIKSLKVCNDSLEDIRRASKAIQMFYDIDKVNLSLTWGLTQSLLVLSKDSKTVTKVSDDLAHATAFGSEGWDSGIHSWKLRVNGVMGLKQEHLYWMMLGVATETVRENQTDGAYVEGHTFGHCTGGVSRYNMGRVSGYDANTPANTVITFVLDCDEGTLAFEQHGSEFLKINVPKKTILYPWVYLYAANNAVIYLV
eukprot:TRINITY_DN2565_c0_g1_i1.p1 TRINITY_DN2565_c0_g1~~TRINITY_DN2565_c0_g1_i1.p1  ORF type:complete len:227 (-),score=31.69 TRINITY_DN2565_c0_g1_i1:12-692(-)